MWCCVGFSQLESCRVYTGLQVLSVWAACTGCQKFFFKCLVSKCFGEPWVHQAFGRRPLDRYARKTQTTQASADLMLRQLHWHRLPAHDAFSVLGVDACLDLSIVSQLG